jgi:hypothetical protein
MVNRRISDDLKLAALRLKARGRDSVSEYWILLVSPRKPSIVFRDSSDASVLLQRLMLSDVEGLGKSYWLTRVTWFALHITSQPCSLMNTEAAWNDTAF